MIVSPKPSLGLRDLRSIFLFVLGLSFLVPFTLVRADEENDPEYRKVVTDRAAKIVEQLGIYSEAKAERVTGIIARQYIDLSRVHDVRDGVIAAAASDEEAGRDAVVEAARNAADAEIYRLHAAFIGKLTSELSAEQVDGVKDGMTYGVAKNTYNVYMKMCPDLSEEQKRQVWSWLVEARELAMDQGSSKEKHGVFGKYKGKINNYLSAAGIDLKEAEKNLYN